MNLINQLLSKSKLVYMGAVIYPDQKIESNKQSDSHTNYNEQKKVEKDYEVEVIQICNTALAIRNKQHTINVELSLRCEGLPEEAFQGIDSMIVVLKSDYSASGVKKFEEIGRTQIVFNQVNPKYIKTFVFPFKQETSQELEFRIYHMAHPETNDLRHQKLIGKVNKNLYSLVDCEKDEQQIKPVPKNNSRATLKMNCSEYDGGNSYYQIMMELVNFAFRQQVYFVIEAMKNGEAIPIVKSESKKPSRFKQIKVNCNKFQGEDNCGVQIKIFDAVKNKQVGSTKQFSILDNTNDEKTQSHRVFDGGFFMGSIMIHKWKKVTRDSFMSYIVGGARLHLLLAIDFTNSNNHNGRSLHTLDEKGSNLYINAIRQIVGVLQYFSVQNQVALYGFGAKLPPFYKSVSQCFALNGNYFYPNVEGGVEEIVKLYKENIKKIKMHGPTKISQILDLAIKYASEQQIMSKKQSTYYVLLIITDGQINDFQDTVDLIVKAASLPLSILFVGVGDGDQEVDRKMFNDVHILDEDTLNLKSSKTGKMCERDIVDFIKMSDFAKDQTKQTLAKQTFSQIPNHFIDYMSSKNIKPQKKNKSLKAAKAQFIAQKIKNPQKSQCQQFMSSFLDRQKKEMEKKLLNLGFNQNDPLVEKMQIAMNDLSYFIEVYSQNKKAKSEQIGERIQQINTRQIRKLQQYLDKKDQDKKTKTLQKLEKIEGNQYGRCQKVTKKPEEKIIEEQKILNHPCIKCRREEINMVHMECGHSSQCFKCFKQRCPVCYHINKFYKKFKYNENGELQCSDSEPESDNQ